MLWMLLACLSPNETPAPNPDDTQLDQVPEEICDDGVDNDGDGRVDCQDGACAVLPICEELCGDGVDNDGDGEIDCADPECIADLACQEDCGDGLDNDQDGAIDCEDLECQNRAPCVEFCTDGEDNDLDGLIDCEDPDCTEALSCLESCTDGMDNDLDGRVDCKDSDCAGLYHCLEDCSDGSDNNGNGLVDCEDAECTEWCSEPSCSDGSDNDADGYTDCEDEDCWGREDCGVAMEVFGIAGDYTASMVAWDYTPSSVSDRRSHYALINGFGGDLRVQTYRFTHSCEFSLDTFQASALYSGSSRSLQTRAQNLRLSSDCALPWGASLFSSSQDLSLSFQGARLKGPRGVLLYAYNDYVAGGAKNYPSARYSWENMSFRADTGDIWRFWAEP